MEKRKGIARFKDPASFIQWFKDLPLEEAESLYKEFKAVLKREGFVPVRNSQPFWFSEAENMLHMAGWDHFSDMKEAEWLKRRGKKAERIERFIKYAIEFDQPLRVGQWVDGAFAFLYVGNPQQGILVPRPERYLEFVPDTDYSDMTPGQVRAMLGAPRQGGIKSVVPQQAEAQLTARMLSSEMDAKKEELAQKEREIEAAQKHQTEELAAIQAKIDILKADLEKKKAATLADLDRKKAKMEEELERIGYQMFLLDSQIYAIRCFAGETIRFSRIRSGKKAPDEEPIIVHQKLRFLDEDLGRLASLYEIQWEEIDLFEEFLKHSPLALDTFAPNNRCVQLVRLSRTGVQQGRDNKYPFENVMRNFRYYHGGTVGIIIRNGENLYLGWTEEDRVHIEDDFIFSNVVTDVRPEEPREFHFESERKRYEQKRKQERKDLIDAVVSRAFVYNILQGVVEHSDMLPLPKGISIGKQSMYVKFAVADKWLLDTRFGSFTDIIKQVNQRITAGDMVLTVQAITPERSHHGWDQSWHNSRGRGDRNLTHDCRAEDCTIYPVNLVELEEPVTMVRYRYLDKDFITGKERWLNSQIAKRQLSSLSRQIEVIEEYERIDRHVFVSLKKRGEFRDYTGDARANVELYEEEYINLTYLNSVWLEWVVNTKTLGDWKVHGLPVDYAYAIRYVKTALDHVRKREEREKVEIDAIDPAVCRDANWPVTLSEWKLKAGVRKITPYQAKRFVKAALAQQ